MNAASTKTACLSALFSAIQRCDTQPKRGEFGIFPGLAQSGQAAENPPKIARNGPSLTESTQAFAAVKLAIAVRRRDDFCTGPSRGLWLARRAMLLKESAAMPLAGPMSMTAPPAMAWQQLATMMQPKPPVGPAGTNTPVTTPGGEMGGRNTPTTNPIGLMSGLGVDPGGSSSMGNAAFGTTNNVVKMAGAGNIRALLQRVLAWPGTPDSDREHAGTSGAGARLYRRRVQTADGSGLTYEDEQGNEVPDPTHWLGETPQTTERELLRPVR